MRRCFAPSAAASSKLLPHSKQHHCDRVCRALQVTTCNALLHASLHSLTIHLLVDSHCTCLCIAAAHACAGALHLWLQLQANCCHTQSNIPATTSAEHCRSPAAMLCLMLLCITDQCKGLALNNTTYQTHTREASLRSVRPVPGENDIDKPQTKPGNKPWMH